MSNKVIIKDADILGNGQILAVSNAPKHQAAPLTPGKYTGLPPFQVCVGPSDIMHVKDSASDLMQYL